MPNLRSALSGPLLAATLAPACAPPAPAVVATPAAPPASYAPERRPPERPVLVPQTVTNPRAVAWSPDGRTLAASAEEGVLLFDAAQGAVRGVIPASGYPDWTADGTTLVVRTATEISSWNAATGARRATIDIAKSTAVAWTPVAVAVARGSTIEVFDPLTGARRSSVEAATPTAISIGDSGRRLAAGTKDGALQVWEVQGGAPRVLAKSGPAIRRVSLSPRETSLASLQQKDAGTSVLSIWDVDAGVERRHVELPTGSAARMMWLSDGSALLVGADDKELLVRADSGKVTDLGEVRAVRPSPSGKVLGLLKATEQSTGSTRLPPTVSVWTLSLRELEHDTELEPDIEGGMFNGDLEVDLRTDDRVGYAYYGFYNAPGMIGVSATADGQEGKSLQGSPPKCSEIAWDDGGATVSTRFGDLKLHWSRTGSNIVFEEIEPEPLPQFWGEPDPQPPSPPEPDPLAPETVSEDKGRTITFFPGKRPGQGKIEIIEAGRKPVTLAGLDGHLGLSPDHATLAVVRGGAIELHDAADGKRGPTIRPARRASFASNDLVWSPDGKTLTVREIARAKDAKKKKKGSDGVRGGFTLWDARTGKQLFTHAEGEWIRFGSLGDPPAPALAFTAPDRLVLLDAHTGAERASLTGRLCWSPILGGNRVVATCRHGSKEELTVWEPGTREIPLASHPTRFSSPALSRDGRFVAAYGTSQDGVFLWSARTGELVERFAPHGDQPFAFSPDGRFLAVGGNEGATLIRLADRQHLHLVERAHEGLAYTDDLLFDGDTAAASELRARLGGDLLRGETVTLSQIADRYRRPGLVEAFFAGQPVALPPELAAGVGVPPKVTLAKSPVVDDQTTVTLRVVDHGGGIEAVVFQVEGKPVDVPPPTQAELQGGVVERAFPVPVGAKKVTISAYATAAQGSTRSAPEQITVEKPAPKDKAPAKK